MPVSNLRRPESSITGRFADFLLSGSTSVSLIRIVGVAFVLRMILVALVFHGLPGSANQNEFGWEIGWTARSIATSHGFSSPFFPATGPTALVPPVYTYLLGGIFRLLGLYSVPSAFAILALNSVFSALTCLPIYGIAREAVGERLARIAAWSWVIYPFSIYYAVRVWEYALTALLFTTCVYIAISLHKMHRARSWVGFGLLYGFTGLVNPAVLSVLPFLLIVPATRLHRNGFAWFSKAALSLIMVLAVLAPWTIFASRAMHNLVPIRDGYWLEFYAGNNGDTFESNAAWAHPASNPVEMQRFEQLGETNYLAEKHRLAVDFVSHHPGWFAVATARRVVRYWTGFWSFGRKYLETEYLDVPNVFFCTTVTVLMVFGARRLWLWNRESAVQLLALIAFFPVSYYLSHASMDYRQPIEPVIVILAAVGAFGVDAGAARRSRREREVLAAS